MTSKLSFDTIELVNKKKRENKMIKTIKRSELPEMLLVVVD